MGKGIWGLGGVLVAPQGVTAIKAPGGVLPLIRVGLRISHVKMVSPAIPLGPVMEAALTGKRPRRHLLSWRRSGGNRFPTRFKND